MDAIIKFDLVLRNDSMRCDSCDVCGAGFWEVGVIAKSPDNVFVCGKCLKHPDEIDARLEQHAADIEQRATELMQSAQKIRTLIGRIQTLPSFKEWRAAENDCKTLEQYCEIYWDGVRAEECDGEGPAWGNGPEVVAVTVAGDEIDVPAYFADPHRF